MNARKRSIFPLLSGLLLFLSWPDRGLNFLVFGALLPWLLVLDDLRSRKEVKRRFLKVFFLSWLLFAVFNGATGWWVGLAHWSGLVAMVFIAASLEALLMTLWLWVSRQIGERRGLWAFPFFWITHEWILNSWDMEWPWLKLGYALADRVEWIQWYSVTGVWGGSLWILLVNLLLFVAWRNWMKKRTLRSFLPPVLAFLLPFLVSLFTYHNWEEKGEEVEVVVVQPNIEPYVEKFERPAEEQLEIFLAEAQKGLDPTTDYLIGPETLLPSWNNLDRLKREHLIRRLAYFRESQDSGLHIVTGLNLIRYYNEPLTETAREGRGGGYWYDVFNSAIQLSAADSIPVYHKSKLVVGAEKMPFIEFLQPILGEIVLDFGGISGTNRTQAEREVFHSDDGRFAVAPIICWEAEFSGFVRGYSQKGADLFLAITNDGWWGDSEGHRQHLHYMRVRAIENRRAVARSANTGISALIDQRGALLQTLAWEERGHLKGSLRANREMSVYVQAGDVLLRLTALLVPLFLLYAFSRYLRRSEPSV